MGLGQFIKKLIEANALFGTAKNKIAGIQDKFNIITDTAIFNATDNSLTFSGAVPTWMVENKYFRITAGGGGNYENLLQVKKIVNSSKIIVFENLLPFTGQVTLDGRMAIVHNDPNISRLGVDGNTIFNIDNVNSTGLPDGSAIATVSVGHYHSSSETADITDDILTHTQNAAGSQLMTYDINSGQHIEDGPFIVIDNDGNVVRKG